MMNQTYELVAINGPMINSDCFNTYKPIWRDLSLKEPKLFVLGKSGKEFINGYELYKQNRDLIYVFEKEQKFSDAKVDPTMSVITFPILETQEILLPERFWEHSQHWMTNFNEKVFCCMIYNDKDMEKFRRLSFLQMKRNLLNLSDKNFTDDQWYKLFFFISTIIDRESSDKNEKLEELNFIIDEIFANKDKPRKVQNLLNRAKSYFAI